MPESTGGPQSRLDCKTHRSQVFRPAPSAFPPTTFGIVTNLKYRNHRDASEHNAERRLSQRVETVAGDETIPDCGTRHKRPCPKHRQITRQGQRHSSCLKLSRCRASCGIHILRQRYCTRLKLRHGLSASIRKRTRLRNGSKSEDCGMRGKCGKSREARRKEPKCKNL